MDAPQQVWQVPTERTTGDGHAAQACMQLMRASWRRSRNGRQPVSESRLVRVSWLAAASLAALLMLGRASSSRVDPPSEERHGSGAAPAPAHRFSSCAAACLDSGFPCRRQAAGRGVESREAASASHHQRI